MSAYYPSTVVTIKMTFDESLHIQTMPDPTSVETLVAPSQGGFPGQTIETTSAGGRVIVLPDMGNQPSGEPAITQSGERNVSFIHARVPRKGSVELPGYRQAGQFSFEFDFREIPIDPRLIRSFAVEVFQGTVDPSDFGTGMISTNPDGTRRSVLRTIDDAGQRNDAALAMVGIGDEWRVVHNASGSVVTISGRDMRGPLLDVPANVVPGASQQLVEQLDWTRPVNEVCEQILRFCPLFDQVRIVVNPAEWPDGTIPAPLGLSQATASATAGPSTATTPRHRRGADGRRTPRATPPGDPGQVSFWDLITRACFFVGAIPYFEGDVLRIRPSRSIFDQARLAGIDPTIPTPFAGGRTRTTDPESNTPIDPPLQIRRLVYGRDTEEVSLDRRFGGFRRPHTFMAAATNPSSTQRGGQQIVGRWPPADASASARTTRRSAGGQESHEEVSWIPPSQVPAHATTVEQLTEVCRAVYEEVGRGEIGGACETKSLASFGGDNSDPDLLRLRPGDGVEFLVDTRGVRSGAPLVAALTDFQRGSFEEVVDDIAARIGDRNLARVLVATSRGLVQEMQRFFRVQTVRYTWDMATGFRIAFDFQNYVVPRNQLEDAPSDPGAQETLTTPTGGRIQVLDDMGNTPGISTGVT